MNHKLKWLIYTFFSWAADLYYSSNMASDMASKVIKMLLRWVCCGTEAKKHRDKGFNTDKLTDKNTHAHTHLVRGININQTLRQLKLTVGRPEQK